MFFVQIVVGVGAVIVNEKYEVLLVYRKKEPEQFKWSIPGGKVELYEQLEETVIREIKEEVNADIRIKQLLCTAETIHQEREEHFVSIIYSAELIGGNVKNNEPDKLGEVRWFPLHDLPKDIASFSVEALEITKKG